MFKQFPFFKQRDTMDCGPTCLRMVAAFHGKNYTLPYLRAESHISRAGVSMEGICNAAEQIGFRAVGVKIPFTIEGAGDEDNASLMNAPMPCIVHWQQRHFIVVKKVTPKYVWVADPAVAQFKLPRKVFEQGWLSDGNTGVALLMDTTPEFYRLDNMLHLDKPTGLLSLLDYLRPFRGLVVNIVVAMFIGSIFQLIFPLMTQSIVDVGIENHQMGFIYLILIGQLMLFGSQTMIEFIQSRILLHVGTRVNVAMVNDFLIKLMRLPIGYFDSKMVGDLIQRVGDQSRIEAFLTNSALNIVFSLFNFAVFSILLFLYNPSIFGIFILSAVLYIGWIAFFLRQRKALDYMRFQQMSSNQGMMIEIVQGMQELKLQGSEHKHRMDWSSIQAKMFYISQKSLSLGQWQEAGAIF